MQNRDELYQNEEVELGETRIMVIGVGGCGKNAINHMFDNDVKDVTFVAMNTDGQDLKQSKAEIKLQLGRQLTRGHGAGENPEIGRRAAEEQAEEIRRIVKGYDLVFLTCGMGGGTGTGATPVIAKICQEEKIITIAVVTKPFTMEGATRKNFAIQGIENLKPYVDILICIPNDKIFTLSAEPIPIIEAFARVNKVLMDAVQGISDLINLKGLINLDFADVKKVIQKKGTALMGVGHGVGPTRFIDAVTEAIHSPLLDVDINGASNALVQITSDTSITAQDIDLILGEVRRATTQDVNIINGCGYNLDFVNECVITIVATGYNNSVPKTEKPMTDTFGGRTETSSETKGETIDQTNVPSWLRGRL